MDAIVPEKCIEELCPLRVFIMEEVGKVKKNAQN